MLALKVIQTIAAKVDINKIAIQAINTPTRGENTSKNEVLEVKIPSGKQIGELMHAARVNAVDKLLKNL